MSLNITHVPNGNRIIQKPKPQCDKVPELKTHDLIGYLLSALVKSVSVEEMACFLFVY